MEQEELRVLHLHLKAASRKIAFQESRTRVLIPTPTVTDLFYKATPPNSATPWAKHTNHYSNTGRHLTYCSREHSHAKAHAPVHTHTHTHTCRHSSVPFWPPGLMKKKLVAFIEQVFSGDKIPYGLHVAFLRLKN